MVCFARGLFYGIDGINREDRKDRTNRTNRIDGAGGKSPSSEAPPSTLSSAALPFIPAPAPIN